MGNTGMGIWDSDVQRLDIAHTEYYLIHENVDA